MQSTNGIVNNNNSSDKSPLGDGKESITTSKMDEPNNALKGKKEEQSIISTAVSESTEKIAGIKISLSLFTLPPTYTCNALQTYT